jgi:SGNH hydrolase-like domain, acetyltransferase AlgX
MTEALNRRGLRSFRMPGLKSTLRVGREVLIVVLITVALGELSLRIYNSVDPLPIFYSDSYNRFRGKPFAPDWSFHLNSRGFKDAEFSPTKDAGTIRILGIGDNRAFEARVATALSYISEMKRLCDDRNIGLTIVLIPDEVQVSRPLQTQVIAESGLSPGSFDFALPNRLLRARLEELKVDYIDLLTEFSARSLNERLYRPNDSHWNIAGNALAARLIWQHVSTQLGAVDK